MSSLVAQLLPGFNGHSISPLRKGVNAMVCVRNVSICLNCQIVTFSQHRLLQTGFDHLQASKGQQPKLFFYPSTFAEIYIFRCTLHQTLKASHSLGLQYTQIFINYSTETLKHNSKLINKSSYIGFKHWNKIFKLNYTATKLHNVIYLLIRLTELYWDMQIIYMKWTT